MGKMVHAFGMDFAPLTTPMIRRLQTLTVIFGCSLFVLFPLVVSVTIVAIIWMGNWYLRGILIVYFTWWAWDALFVEIQKHGGRRSRWLRKSLIGIGQRDYFPVKLIKTADLPPDKNYLFGTHPHGIMGVGPTISFGTDACGFPELFPGITPYFLTLSINFLWPLLRCYYLGLGLCDVGKDSIQWILNKNGTGNAAIIVIGGAEEALEAHPGTFHIYLKSRKGFVKMALRFGASLVPCFTFGENDLFMQVDNPAGSWLRRLQSFLKSVTGISPVLFHGRGIFQYTFGFLPFRRPIHTVVGAPIDVPHIPEPSDELIDKYHNIYMDGLSELFDAHKTKYGIDESISLDYF